MNQPCFVYFIQAARVRDWPGRERIGKYCRPFKIGISDNPNGRIAQFQTGVPFEIEIYTTWKLPSRDAAFKIEQDFIKIHQSFRIYGEWFFCCIFGCAEAVSQSVVRFSHYTLGLSGITLLRYVADSCAGQDRLDFECFEYGDTCSASLYIEREIGEFVEP